MRRVLVTVALFLLTLPAQPVGDCGDELVLRANAFAGDYNDFFRIVDANQDRQDKRTDRLNREWQQLYRLLKRGCR